MVGKWISHDEICDSNFSQLILGGKKNKRLIFLTNMANQSTVLLKNKP